MTLSAPSGDKIVHMDGDVLIIETRNVVAVHQIISNMHPAHFDQFGVLNEGVETAYGYVNEAKDAYLVRYKGKATFYFGTNVSHPHLRWFWGFGTPMTKRVIPAVARWALTRWAPKLFEQERVTRIETRLSSSHQISWLKRFGMREECTLHHVGLTSEPFVQLSFTKDDYAKCIQRAQASESYSGRGSTHEVVN